MDPQHGEGLRYGHEFREQLNDEVKNLEVLIEKWTNERPSTSQGRDEIDSALGKARLLIRSKLEQFRKLTYDAEDPKDSQKISKEDLAGFWDLVGIQIEGCHSHFARLDALKSRNWVAIPPTVPSPPKTLQRRNAK